MPELGIKNLMAKNQAITHKGAECRLRWLYQSIFCEMFGRFSIYALVGVIGTLAHYSILIGLVELCKVSVLVATTIGAIFGAAVNYIFNYRFTFKSNAGHLIAMPKFFSIAALGFLLNSILMHMLVNTMEFAYLPSQLLTTIAVLLSGYTANAFWTFCH
ncbi:MAG: GtrA family protein [Candidatus Saccharibacteria bacterium]